MSDPADLPAVRSIEIVFDDGRKVISEGVVPVPDEPLLTAFQVADRLKVHLLTVRRWTREGKIPSIRLGLRQAGKSGRGAIRYRREDVYEFMRTHDRTRPKPVKRAEKPAVKRDRGR